MRKVILIADDSRLYHQMYEDVLSQDYDLLHAYDGVEALQATLTHRPDLIVLDVIMPQMDGRTVCRKIRENPLTAGTRVVMLSARDSQFDRRVGLEVGADDYIEKPCRPGHLKSAIEKLLRAE